MITLVVYSWTILHFFWRLPGWLYFMSIGEVLTVYAYSMATNLLESLLILCLPLGMGIVLPRKLFSDVFTTRGIVVAFSSLAYIAYLLNQFETRDDYPRGETRLLPAVLIASIVLAFLIGKVKILTKAIEFFAEQTTVFLYITVPLSLIALLIVLVRFAF